MTASGLKLAVFDCDGTLVDSQHHIVAAVVETWRRHDLPPPAAALVRTGIGLPLHQTLSRLAPDGDAALHDSLTDTYKAVYTAMRQNPDHWEPLYPGVVETLDRLSAAGWLLGIATGKAKRGLLAVLDMHEMKDRFVVLRTADDGPGKPHPFMLTSAMAEIGVEPADTVMIGDTSFDIEMARAAGTLAVGVSWGYHPIEMLQAAGAHHLVHDYSTLAATLLTRTPS
ncbi:MAG: HAD-IA family hydrolase [Oceanibaculum nanhaiense]|uniref:HAD-IA family hydrolase n=1 Tax=Oceanibaculum nanhaiense TaxID=1909734 RepID=UPI0025A4820F|nr:HAD-IA family hydrolase [Oceanibaculum nanhaiense]MDM7947144.1 HAD-IA family hydrolase [Oceanibaculum nanhaiense]